MTITELADQIEASPRREGSHVDGHVAYLVSKELEKRGHVVGVTPLPRVSCYLIYIAKGDA